MLTKRLITSRIPRASNALIPQSSRLISSTAVRRAGDHSAHESHYNPPGGWLWGERPGEKYEKEGWENLFYWGFCGSWIVAIIAYTMKEDTSIQTWALEEARRRLEQEGILEESNK